MLIALSSKHLRSALYCEGLACCADNASAISRSLLCALHGSTSGVCHRQRLATKHMRRRWRALLQSSLCRVAANVARRHLTQHILRWQPYGTQHNLGNSFINDAFELTHLQSLWPSIHVLRCRVPCALLADAVLRSMFVRNVMFACVFISCVVFALRSLAAGQVLQSNRSDPSQLALRVLRHPTGSKSQWQTSPAATSLRLVGVDAGTVRLANV